MYFLTQLLIHFLLNTFKHFKRGSWCGSQRAVNYKIKTEPEKKKNSKMKKREKLFKADGTEVDKCSKCVPQSNTWAPLICAGSVSIPPGDAWNGR